MTLPVTEPKDIVRLQFDVRRAQLNIIDRLVDVCGLSSKKELFSNAMALMKWAVQETQNGRRIASYDQEKDEVMLVALPALDLISSSKDVTAVKSPASTSVQNRTDRRSTAGQAKIGAV